MENNRPFEITDLAGENLENVRGRFGLMTVYAKVTTTGGHGFTTAVDFERETNPKWDTPLRFTLHDPSIHNSSLYLNIQFFCDRTFKSDKYISGFSVPVKRLFDEISGNVKSPRAVRYPVVNSAGREKGFVKFSFKFGELPKPTSKQQPSSSPPQQKPPSQPPPQPRPPLQSPQPPSSQQLLPPQRPKRQPQSPEQPTSQQWPPSQPPQRPKRQPQSPEQPTPQKPRPSSQSTQPPQPRPQQPPPQQQQYSQQSRPPPPRPQQRLYSQQSRPPPPRPKPPLQSTQNAAVFRAQFVATGQVQVPLSENIPNPHENPTEPALDNYVDQLTTSVDGADNVEDYGDDEEVIEEGYQDDGVNNGEDYGDGEENYDEGYRDEGDEEDYGGGGGDDDDDNEEEEEADYEDDEG